MMARRGQVALYLLLVLVVICVLTIMNVGVYLGISAKNRATNAGDAAALSVAKMQGELLNAIGRLNVDHLRHALSNDLAACAEDVEEQLRLSFLGPLDGIRLGNHAARENGVLRDTRMEEILRRHVTEIRRDYATTPDLYPEPWPGAWGEYAAELELRLSEGLWAGPDNIDYIDAQTGHLLLNRAFYEAVAGRNWCWFRFNAAGVLAGYSTFTSWPPLPESDGDVRARKCVNSEIYSLGLQRRVGSAVDLLGAETIFRLTGCTPEEFADSTVITNADQVWLFYDTHAGTSGWSPWTELHPESLSPYVGSVKEEYDVRGCAAVCRVCVTIPQVMSENDAAEETTWSSAAKPFGTEENENGGRAVVTCCHGFVTPAFEEVRLVSVPSVGGWDLATSDPDWATHVRQHLRDYLASGPVALGNCFYCAQLKTWERSDVRTQATAWLKLNSGSCTHPGHGQDSRGALPPH